MLCDTCNQNEATIFLTQIVEDETSKAALCATCGAPFIEGLRSSPELIERLHKDGIEIPPGVDAFAAVAALDLRYTEEAFYFVREGVARAVRAQDASSRHVTAAELLEALRALAIERYGLLARDRLGSWGVTSCEDFGEIVFTLIERGLFGQRPEDKKEDFSHGFDFAVAFPASRPED